MAARIRDLLDGGHSLASAEDIVGLQDELADAREDARRPRADAQDPRVGSAGHSTATSPTAARARIRRRWRLLRAVRSRQTWRNLHHEFDRMHPVTLATGDARVAQCATLTARHKSILNRSRAARTAAILRLHVAGN